MLYLIGIGLNKKQMTLEARKKIKDCDELYCEDYTSFYSGDSLAGKKIRGVKLLKREEVEGDFLVEKARDRKIGLLVFGNPLNATTHMQLVSDCVSSGVEIEIVMGIGVFDILGLSGLDPYKFGRTVTLVFQEENYFPKSFYEQILGNLREGLHTLCLLDIKRDKEKFMTAWEGLELLEQIDREGKLKNQDYIALCGIGGKKEKILIGREKIKKFSKKSSLPQSLIIAGKINEKEKEFLEIVEKWKTAGKKK